MKNIILYAIIGVLAVLVAVFGFRYFQGQNSDGSGDEGSEGGNGDTSEEVQTGSISGKVEYSGIKPQTGEAGFVYIEYRDHDTGQFQKLEELKIPLEDDADWRVDDVPVGKVYDARAVLQLNSGEIITRSNTITVSAPAQNEIFELNVTYAMLPDEVVENTPVSMEGSTSINGYIPTGSTVSVYTREKDSEENIFAEVVSTPIIGQSTTWSWDEALIGRHYEIKTEAFDSAGNLIAASNVGERAAPADDIVFVITSRATDPNDTTQKTISGTVKINGNYSNNATTHIKARETGDSEYKTVATVSPSNSSVSWSWDEATHGVQYDIKPFIVEQSQEDIKGEKVITVAPASGITLVIDTVHSPDAPKNKPTLESCNTLEDNKFRADLTFDNVSDADKYRLQVGKSEGSADVNNSIVNNSGSNDVSLSVNINKGQNYYAQYSYTKCSDCGDSSYSDFSDTLKFKCE